jgi:hypothetical protein
MPIAKCRMMGCVKLDVGDVEDGVFPHISPKVPFWAQFTWGISSEIVSGFTSVNGGSELFVAVMGGPFRLEAFEKMLSLYIRVQRVQALDVFPKNLERFLKIIFGSRGFWGFLAGYFRWRCW